MSFGRLNSFANSTHAAPDDNTDKANTGRWVLHIFWLRLRLGNGSFV
jgi:hypothetical protein